MKKPRRRGRGTGRTLLKRDKAEESADQNKAQNQAKHNLHTGIHTSFTPFYFYYIGISRKVK